MSTKSWVFPFLAIGIFLFLGTARAESDLSSEVSESTETVETEVDRVPAASRNAIDQESEYNFSWLDPDKKVYVIQNRKYRKAGRFALYGSGGLNLSNAFRTSYTLTGRGAYSITELIGLEAFYTKATNSENSTITALKKVSASALPFVREIKFFYGGMLALTPWYAKINLFNKILYFDWFVNLGAGQVATKVDLNNSTAGQPVIEETTVFAVYFTTGQNFFITRNVVARLEVAGMFFRAKGADNATLKNNTNFDFTVGLGYLF